MSPEFKIDEVLEDCCIFQMADDMTVGRLTVREHLRVAVRQMVEHAVAVQRENDARICERLAASDEPFRYENLRSAANAIRRGQQA